MPKIEVCLRRIDFIKRKEQGMLFYYRMLISGFSCYKYQVLLIKAGRSDATILGIFFFILVDPLFNFRSTAIRTRSNRPITGMISCLG